MSRDRWFITKTDEREKLLDRATEITGENTDAAVFEDALLHLVESHEVYEELVEDDTLTPRRAKQLNTSVLKIGYNRYPEVHVL